MRRKEIFYCDLIVIKNNKEVKIENVVWMETETEYKKMIIKEVIKHKSLGFQSLQKDYTEVTKSNEKRNNITGAYD
jgi:ribosomal 50S subunit-recycling heat shock protein